MQRVWCAVSTAILLSPLAGCGDDADLGPGTDATTSSSDETATSSSTSPGTTSSDAGTTADTSSAGTDATTSGTSESTESGDETSSDSGTGGEPAVPWYVPDSLTQLCAQVDVEDATECPEASEVSPGQDGDYSINPPTYEVSSPGGDDIVTDTATALVWQASISPDVAYDAAVSYCDGLNTAEYAGRTDWRLPTRRELMGIWDMKSWLPVSDEIFAPQFGTELPQNAIYWTMTAVAGAVDRHWGGSGNWAWLAPVDDDDMEFDSHHARCVAGDPTPTDVYTTTDGGQTVTHDNTSLVWTSTVVGAMDWGEALNYCEGLDHAGESDWRLPTIKELYSFLDESRDLGTGLLPAAIDAASGVLWSSTPMSYNEINVVHIADGSGNGISYDSDLDALCVRGGNTRNGSGPLHHRD
jgi:hypothetical protein